MVYSEVVANGWILPKKARYTAKDVSSVIKDSLSGNYGKRKISSIEATFIVRCSAAHWDTDCSI